MDRMTQAERLARIETLLESELRANGDAAKAAVAKLEEMDARWTARFEKLERELRAEMTAIDEKQSALELAWAEAKGTVRGVKLGWAAAFVAIGAGALAAIEKIMEAFK